MVISGLSFHFVEIEMRGWTLRVEPEETGDENRGPRHYILTKTIVGCEPASTTMDSEALSKHIPFAGGHMLVLMNDKDFIRLEHSVGRSLLRIVPKDAVSIGGKLSTKNFLKMLVEWVG